MALKETVKNMIESIKSGNSIEAKVNFKAAISELVQKKIEEMRQKVGKSMFKKDSSC